MSQNSSSSQHAINEMRGYASKLLRRTEIARETVAFHFERPHNFQFRPGQFIELTLGDQGDVHALTHTFSIANAPSADEIVVATRMRDTAFKRILSALPIGTQVRIDGPWGAFTLHNNTARPAVLIAGGIGITPFMSILAHAAVAKLRHPLILFYANRDLDDAAFMDELWQLEQANPRFRFVPIFTRMNDSAMKWQCETGHINVSMLSRHVGALRGPIFYIAGPPRMVAMARQTLVEALVDEDDIRTEEFGGY